MMGTGTLAQLLTPHPFVGYDYVLYVTAEAPPSSGMDATTVLAYASTCQFAAEGLPGRRTKPATCRYY
jgi:hypothetical protein